ncbi:MAG: VWA domain-containing protein, partial [Desulfobulbaceae bacterium]|nr:VWA domain-containing protein [Desulfobulbaceae bacterium]
ALIADFVATPQVKGKGVEIDPVRQFTLVAGEATFHYDEGLTRRLYRQPPTPFVLPPDTPVRFELAFAIPKAAVLKHLDYQGFVSKGPFPLEGVVIGGTRGTAGNNLAAGALPTVASKPVSIEPEPKVSGPTPGAPMETQGPADSGQAEAKPLLAKTSKPPVDPFTPSSEPAKLMPITLPPFDSAQALAEVEPNDKIEQATKFGPGLAASATMSGEDWHDWFSFSVEGEPQLWSIEGSGPGLGRITVVAAGERKLAETQSSAGELKPGETLRVDNVLLLPGRYWIDAERRSGMAGGTYNLRAVPLGRPDRTAEFEPNDHVSQALPLEFGMPRRGLIGRDSDVDLYRFFLTKATHLRLTLTPPPALPTILKLEGNGLSKRIDPLPGDDKKLSYDALLQPGIYTVNVYADGQGKSETPYELRLDRLDPFNLPVDIEPNDTAPMAVRLGARRQFSGTLGRYDQSDYFRLPELKAKTICTVTGEGKDSFDIAYIVDGSDKRTDAVEVQEKRTESSKTYQTTLEPGTAYMLRVNGSEPYRMSLTFDPDPGGTADIAPGEALEVSFRGKPPVFAAYRDEAQEASLGVKVTNHSPDAQEVTLDATAAETGWQIDFPQKTLTLKPGQSTETAGHLRAAPDRSSLRETPIDIRARGKAVASITASLPVKASCSAAALGPMQEQPLPAALLGGLNLAWSALGGQPAAADAAVRQRQAQLFDGMTPLQQQFEVKPWEVGNEIDVRLAGGGPVKIAGITLIPANTEGYLVDRAPFTVFSSLDGKAYAPVYSGIMEPTEIEQAFVFDAPHEATHLRLQFSAVDGIRYSGGTKLAEWKAIAVPGSRPLGEFNPNLAAPALGGHLVWVSWDHADYRSESALLTETDEQRYFRVEALKPVEWVVGFHNDRAARIASLQWRESANAEQGYRRIERVTVSASMKGPAGPWLPVGDWKLPGIPGGEAELVLPAPVWARFLRFSAPAYDKTVSLRIAETLRIFEQAEDDSYRSMLGEWGHYRQAAYYETLKKEGGSADVKSSAGGDTREHAIPLTTDKRLAGRVEVGKRVDWFEVKVPSTLDRLEFAFGGNDASRLEPSLEDKNGTAVVLEEADETNAGRIFHAQVTPGASYYLKVAEAKRSIMIVWDNSSSVGSFHETMYRSISRLADDIRPGEEVINLMPLVEGANPRTLIPDWSADPLAVKRAIGEYDRKDTSSNSEHTLLGALKRLAERPGNRGIVLLTDADSPGQGENAPLWTELGKVRPRIFTVELQLNSDGAAVSHFQDLMQDWAAVNNGYYSVFHNQADLDVAFDRAACRMRQPAEYDVSWHPAPGTGTLIVEWEKGKAMAGATVELILDASGSMVSPKNKVGGKLKMDVAREVMLEIVGLLPIDTQVGLRLYGHRRKDGTKGACEDSELVAPIAGLDRSRLEERIKGVKALGGTPIAYSLTEAGKDMANIKGPQLILLVTDGKEECKGNPAAVVEVLKAQGIDARIDIVGFALTDQKDKDDMAKVAKIAGGRFFDAQNRAALASSIGESLAMPFVVTDSRDRQVSEGLTGQSPNALYQGNYSVIVHTAKGDVTVRDVKIMEGKPTKIMLSREGDEIKTSIETPATAK